MYPSTLEGASRSRFLRQNSIDQDMGPHIGIEVR